MPSPERPRMAVGQDVSDSPVVRLQPRDEAAQWRAVRALVEAALEVPRPERAGFLASADVGAGVCEAAMRWLAACERAEHSSEFLGEAAAQRAAPLLDVQSLPDAPAAGDPLTVTALREALAPAYEVEREIGRGGMATVYLARDRALGRAVAVKVLVHSTAAGLSAARFAREIRLAARLQHPHIVPVHAADEFGGLPYYTMPFVNGESLRERLRREGALPIAEAVRLLRELSDALCHAHEQGVVHRDLKPENVLLSRGHAMVTDFGVAKALTSETQGGDLQGGAGAPEAMVAGTTTGLRVAVGTPAYMAPEQLLGDAALDHRADLYALGVIAYELLTGTHPFAGRALLALVTAHLTETPAPFGERRPEVPVALGALVARLLAKRPEDRPATAEEVLDALAVLDVPRRTGAGVAPAAAPLAGRRPRSRATWAGLMAVVLVVLVVLMGVGFVLRDRLAASRAAAGTSTTETARAAVAPVGIAILPFESRAPADGTADADFADGLADAIRSQLAQLPALRVIDGRSAGQYKGSTKSVREIGRELGVPYVLQASVQWARTADGTRRVRVSPALVRVADAATIWSVPLTPQPQDAFEAQTEVAMQVAEALDVRLGSRERALLGRAPTRNAAAYEEYLRGLALRQRAMFNPLLEELPQATQAFTRAVELDPTFGLAWAQLAYASVVLWRTDGGGNAGELTGARAALDNATRLAPELLETHVARAEWAFSVDDDQSGGVQALRAADAARPGDVYVMSRLSRALLWTRGGLDESIAYAVRAAELDPRSLESNTVAAAVLSAAGQPSQAIRYAERAIVLAPDQFIGYHQKARALIGSGAGVAVARAVLDSATAHLGESAVTRSMLDMPAMSAPDVFGAPYDQRLEALTLANYPAPRAVDSAEDFYLAKATHWWQRGQRARARANCDSLRAVLAGIAGAAPADQVARRHVDVAAALAITHACLGHRTEALRWIEPVLAIERQSSSLLRTNSAAFGLAATYVLLGERDSAVGQLERLVVPPTNFPARWVGVDPFWAPLRGLPRFDALLARVPR